MVVYSLHEFFHSSRNCLDFRHSVLAVVLCEKSPGADCAVYLRSDDALGKESAVHSHFVLHPLIVVSVHIERGKKRDVVACKVVNSCVTESSVCHVYDSGRSDAVSGSVS